MKCFTSSVWLLLVIIVNLPAQARQHGKPGVGFTFEAGQHIVDYNDPRIAGYKFHPGVPLGASLDFTFSSKNTCGLMMSLSAEYTSYRVIFDYKSSKMRVREEHRSGVGGVSVPVFFFIRTKRDEWLFALGATINFRRQLFYRHKLEYDNPYAQHYQSSYKYGQDGSILGIGAKCIYRINPKSALSIYAHYDYVYGGFRYAANFTPKENSPIGGIYSFQGLPFVFTASIGYQLKLLPSRRKNPPPPVIIEDIKPEITPIPIPPTTETKKDESTAPPVEQEK